MTTNERDAIARARTLILDIIDQQVRHEVIRHLPAIVRIANDFQRAMDNVERVTGDDWQMPDISGLYDETPRKP